MKKNMLVLVVAVVLGVVIGIILRKDRTDSLTMESKSGIVSVNPQNIEEAESYGLERIDADEYYEQNAEIVSEIDAKSSKAVQTEKDVYKELENRGFSQFPIYAEYALDGSFFEEVEISDSSSEKHPMYTTYFASESEELWTIFLINGQIMAKPVSYNLQSSLSAQLIIAESDMITSYDSFTGKFYETIPKESALIVKVVKRIDADTLEKLSVEEIDKL